MIWICTLLIGLQPGPYEITTWAKISPADTTRRTPPVTFADDRGRYPAEYIDDNNPDHAEYLGKIEYMWEEGLIPEDAQYDVKLYQDKGAWSDRAQLRFDHLWAVRKSPRARRSLFLRPDMLTHVKLVGLAG